MPIQKGYRVLLEDFKSQEETLRKLMSSSPEPTPSTPRQRSGTLSRVSSAKFSVGGLDVTPNGNPFMKFPKGHGVEPQGPSSPSPTPNKLQSSKRTRTESESPPRKRSKSGK